MTRINIVPVTELADQHLMAEYRELPMVPAALKRTLASKHGWQCNRVSDEYTLNKGHVYFFTNKRAFLRERFDQLVAELRHREYKIDPAARSINWDIFDGVPQMSWIPTPEDVELNAERIRSRISQKPDWYRWTNRPRTQL